MVGEWVNVAKGNSVAVIACPQELVERLSGLVGDTGKISRLDVANQRKIENQDVSGYDVCVIGSDSPLPISEEILSSTLRLLKPGGRLWILATIVDDVKGGDSKLQSKNGLQSTLKLNGFVDVEFKTSETEKEKSNVDGGKGFCCVSAGKPNYEVGASAPLKLTAGVKKDQAAAQVWKLSANDMDDDDDDTELLDSDAVLDEEDLKKPDPASLRAVCGDAATKRKACKNCSCGLAEELEAEKTKQAPEGVDPGEKKSSCGSCYLGDAFRCASCPYRGLPAFKPGEKVILQ